MIWSNSKIQLLENDFVDLKHPQTEMPVRVYRIISLRDIRDDIPKSTVGGYVQNVSNLNENDSSWIFNNAKVFDSAIVKGDDCNISENALIFGKAVVDNSAINGTARIYDNAMVESSVIMNNCDVFENAKILNSNMANASKIFGNASVVGSSISQGATIHGSARVSKSRLKDVSEARGSAVLENMVLLSRSVVESGEHRNQTYSNEVELLIKSGLGDL
jgi:NDP-sugar pyrophosphorylase family protein